MSENLTQWLESISLAFSSIGLSKRNIARRHMTEVELSEKFGGEDSQSDDSRQSTIDFLKGRDVAKKHVAVHKNENLRYGSNTAIIENLKQRIKEHPESAEYIQPQIDRLMNS